MKVCLSFLFKISIGMDESDIPHIFERFFDSIQLGLEKMGGTGLGLSIAKWIIDNHKGYFSVLSRKEIGTRITVFLPQNKKDAFLGKYN